MLTEHTLVELLQKFHGFQIFAPAVFVGNPLPFVAVIIKIQHRRHRVNAQSVNVIFAQPKIRTGHQEGTNLVSAVVKYACSPRIMLAFFGVGVFIQRFAVKFVKTVCVLRKMCGYPVEDDAQARIVAGINQIF